jgi:hypothetical protein
MLPFSFWQASTRLDAKWTPQWNHLVAYWMFNGAGTLANGASVPALVGPAATASGASAYTAGQVEQGITFGSSTELFVTGASCPNPTTQLSVAFWFKDSSPTTDYFTALFYKTDMSVGWAIQKNNTASGKLYMRIDTSAVSNQTSPPLGGMFDGSWHHLVYTLSAGAMKVYLDGAVQAAGALSYSAGSGVGNLGASLYMGDVIGSMDDVGIWDVALSAAEVAVIYNRQK